MSTTTTVTTPPLARSRVTRWTFAGFGVVCVALGALGAVLPVLPTTIFLIIASWAFTRSCPWLEDRLIRNRFFRPFLRYLEPGTVMPRRAQVITLLIMWTSITISSIFLVRGGASFFVVVGIAGAGLIGSWCIYRMGLPRKQAATESVESGSNAPRSASNDLAA